MNCLCLKKSKSKKAAKNGQSSSGVANVGYKKDDGDEVDLGNNAVLEELDELERQKQLESRVNTTPTSSKTTEAGERKGSVTAPRIQVTADVLAGSGASSRRDDSGPLAARDDLCLEDLLTYEYKEVDLVSKDSNGLGVLVSGTITDGIKVSELTPNGPAAESGKIAVGDRILSVTISFENMVYEDALTILSYASPYPVTLRLAQSSNSGASSTETTPTGSSSKHHKVLHPLYRSQSVGGSAAKQKRQQKLLPPRPGTSLGQIHIASQNQSIAASDDSLLGLGFLIKGKFANTLNLTNGSDVTLHCTKDSDVTSSSDRSEDHTMSVSNTSLTGNKDNSAGQDPEYLSAEQRPLSPQAPEKPKRTYAASPDYSLNSAATTPVNETLESVDAEPEIVPASAAKAASALDNVDGAAVIRIPKQKAKGTIDIDIDIDVDSNLPLPQQSVVADPPNGSDTLAIQPVYEEEITPSVKAKPLLSIHSGLNRLSKMEGTEIINGEHPPDRIDIVTNHHLPLKSCEDDLQASGEDNCLQLNGVTTTESLDDDSDLTTREATDTHTHNQPDLPIIPADLSSHRLPDGPAVQEYEEESLPAAYGVKPSSTLSDGELKLLHNSDLDSEQIPSGMHEYDDDSSKETIEDRDTENATAAAAAQSSITAELPPDGSTSNHDDKLKVTRRSTSFLSSEPPRSSFLSRGLKHSQSQSEQADSHELLKASSRSELEAARARFFAELMSTSDLFKDSPSHRFSLSSDGLDSQPHDALNNNNLDGKHGKNSMSLNDLCDG